MGVRHKRRLERVQALLCVLVQVRVWVLLRRLRLRRPVERRRHKWRRRLRRGAIRTRVYWRRRMARIVARSTRLRHVQVRRCVARRWGAWAAGKVAWHGL